MNNADPRILGKPAVFVDRDGVINELVLDPTTGNPESPLRPADVKLIEGASAALARLASSGRLLVGVSNQPAAAKGLVSVDQIYAIQMRVVELLARDSVHFDHFSLCLHHPEGRVPGLSGDCRCRKPQPGMLLDAAGELGIDLSRSWMIGDTDSDALAGKAAGCQTYVVENGQSRHKRGGVVEPDATGPDLQSALDTLLSGGRA